MGTDVGTSDWLVFCVVAGARFLLPLTIPRYPLPGIVASLVLDGIDQTLFQQFTQLPLARYQGYDKALDIYYLTIAYISTLRNWGDLFALRISRFLFYWRLVGVALFELTQLRPLLLVFPNTFEYFFIFYEVCRLGWDPRRLSKKLLVGAAALIWIAIKLPQEYWIHIAQGDVTDWLKTHLFAVPIDTPWSEVVGTWPLAFVGALFLVALALIAAWQLVQRYVPPTRRGLSFSADDHQPRFSAEQIRRAMESEARRIFDAALLEKIVLIALVSISFAQVLPGLEAGSLQLAVGLGLVVTVNTALTHWLARHGFGWVVALRRFLVLAAINTALVLLFAFLPRPVAGPAMVGSALFFALLLTLLVMLFDHYRQVYLMRFEPGDEPHQERWSPFTG